MSDGKYFSTTKKGELNGRAHSFKSSSRQLRRETRFLCACRWSWVLQLDIALVCTLQAKLWSSSMTCTAWRNRRGKTLSRRSLQPWLWAKTSPCSSRTSSIACRSHCDTLLLMSLNIASLRSAAKRLRHLLWWSMRLGKERAKESFVSDSSCSFQMQAEKETCTGLCRSSNLHISFLPCHDRALRSSLRHHDRLFRDVDPCKKR